MNSSLRALRATVVGADPAIDVALLHVTSATPLAAAPIGKSGALRVGEWVCAIGNPLGYVHSVTVVSFGVSVTATEVESPHGFGFVLERSAKKESRWLPWADRANDDS